MQPAPTTGFFLLQTVAVLLCALLAALAANALVRKKTHNLLYAVFSGIIVFFLVLRLLRLVSRTLFGF